MTRTQRIWDFLRSKHLEFATLLAGRYPGFVYGTVRAKDRMPVFAAHDDRAPEWLERCFRRIREGKYRTVGCDECAESWTQGGWDGQSILITFDDGRAELYRVIFPLLKKHGLRCAAFVNPGLIDRESLAGERTRCTWQELREMQASGHVDIQSHGMLHDRAAVSDRVVAFWNPHSGRESLTWNALVRLVEEGAPSSRETPSLGHPVLESAPFFSVERPVVPDPSLAAACVRHVGEFGGVTFFERPDWKSQLLDLVERHRATVAPRILEAAEAQRQMEEDMAAAKRRIEEEVPRHVVRHLAYTWWEGSDMAVRASKATGYTSNYWGVGPYWDGETDVYHIPRLSLDWAARLPGRGRKHLSRIIAMKVLERLRRTN